MMCTQVAILMWKISVSCCYSTDEFQQHLPCSVYTILLYTVQSDFTILLTIILQRLRYQIPQTESVIQCIKH